MPKRTILETGADFISGATSHNGQAQIGAACYGRGLAARGFVRGGGAPHGAAPGQQRRARAGAGATASLRAELAERKFGVKQLCPLCRTELPSGPEKIHPAEIGGSRRIGVGSLNSMLESQEIPD